jgi:IS1 family transposase/transposase-like protein
MICPDCNSENTIRNGSIHNGKPRFRCRQCGRQFAEHPENKIISEETRAIVERLLPEKTPLAGIAGTARVSERWLQSYVSDKYENIQKVVTVTEKPNGCLAIECDEMWSFVRNKKNKYWIWLAKDVYTKVIVGAYVGNRDREGAMGLWNSMPGVYRQYVVIFTYFWKSYNEVLPRNRHRPMGKETGKTNNIESFNCKMRQRISRLVRKTLSFSKKKN